MNREEFLISYWKYYTILEDDFITLTRYVSIDNIIIKHTLMK